MIISCPSCNKKFEIDSDLIPENGRLLSCGSCAHQWFFKRDEIIKKTIPEPSKDEDIIEEISSKDVNEKKIEVPDQSNFKKEIKKLSIKSNEKNIKKTKEKNKTNVKILNLIIVFIISLVAIIILTDTLKTPISKIIPNIEFLLYSLYETIKDVFLFLKDLI